MTRKLLRLELLKLVWRPTSIAVVQAIADAKALEAYCIEPAEEEAKPVETPAEPAKPEPVKQHQHFHKKGNGR